MTWTVEHRTGIWYAVLTGPGRIPTTILRHSQEHADETAAALNRIDTYREAPEQP